MIEDMTMRKLAPKTQTSYIRAVKKLTDYLGHSPDSATAEDLRQFRDRFGRDVDRNMPSNKSVALLELKGTETNSSLYFQSSALPTELPGQGVRKRV
jgi:hypothetical protein